MQYFMFVPFRIKCLFGQTIKLYLVVYVLLPSDFFEIHVQVFFNELELTILMLVYSVKLQFADWLLNFLDVLSITF